MARLPRVVLPGYPHHVTQRGNRRQTVFFCERDFRLYRKLLAESCSDCGTACWAYCLMPNHVHLVLVPDCPDGLRAALAEAHRRYTCHVNIREGWRGHLWQERFHSFPMDEAHLLAAVRYVERNPVAAGLTDTAADWPWSSATAHLRGIDDCLVRVQPLLERVRDWPAYLARASDGPLIERLRKHGRTGRPAGSRAFLAAAEKISGRSLLPRKRGRRPKCGVREGGVK